AGMNAHINRDLPVAVVSTCEHLGIDLEQATPQHHDYVAVNPLLEQTERNVKQWFATGFVGVVDVVCADDDDRIAMWDVCRARDAAWIQARALWALRAVPPLQRAYVDTLDRSVGFAVRAPRSVAQRSISGISSRPLMYVKCSARCAASTRSALPIRYQGSMITSLPSETLTPAASSSFSCAKPRRFG